jgi:hypothetical protein
MADGSRDAAEAWTEADGGLWPRLRALWSSVLTLSWPVMVEQVSRTLMRTVDVFITALFSPAAVVAIGLAELYSQFALRIGLGLGGGAVALTSQETGREGGVSRDETIATALLLGVVLGIPLALAGILFGESMIALLGASPDVVERNEDVDLPAVEVPVVVPELSALGALVAAAVDVGSLPLRRDLEEVLVDVHWTVVRVEVVLVPDEPFHVLDPRRVVDECLDRRQLVYLLKRDRIADDTGFGAAMHVTVPFARV